MWDIIARTNVEVRWSYVPRAGNKVADFLAGIASRQAKQTFYQNSSSPNVQLNDFLGLYDELSPNIFVDAATLSPQIASSVLLQPSALEQLLHLAPVIILQAPRLYNPQLLGTYLAVQGGGFSLPSDTEQRELHYIRSSPHPQGRYYPRGSVWGSFSRKARILGLGPDYWEVDLKGCFYPILRVLTAEFGATPINLPSPAQARSLLDRCYLEGQHNEDFSAKRLLHVAVMRGHAGFEGYLRNRGKEPDLRLFHFLKGIDMALARALIKLLTRTSLRWYSPDFRCSDKNDIYFVLEAAEAKVITQALATHAQSHRTAVLWIHDGFYSKTEPDYPSLTTAAISAIEALGARPDRLPGGIDLVSRKLLNEDLLSCLKVSKLEGVYHTRVEELCRNTPIFARTRFKVGSFARKPLKRTAALLDTDPVSLREERESKKGRYRRT